MNLPNKLSILRICFIPFVMFFYMIDWQWGKLIATVLFVVAVLTDMADGYIARKYNLVTDLGKLLDTNADKILALAGILLVVVDGTIPNPWGILVAVIILGRDMVISAFRQIAASKNFVMAADKLGKIKAIFIDVALSMLLLAGLIQAYCAAIVYDVYLWIGYVLMAIAVVLTIWSMLNYIIKNRAVLKEDKKEEKVSNKEVEIVVETENV